MNCLLRRGVMRGENLARKTVRTRKKSYLWCTVSRYMNATACGLLVAGGASTSCAESTTGNGCMLHT